MFVVFVLKKLFDVFVLKKLFVVFVLKKLFVVCCSRKGLEGENCESAFPCQARSRGLDQLQSMPNLHNFIHTASFCFYIFQGLVTKAEIRSPFPLVPASPPSRFQLTWTVEAVSGSGDNCTWIQNRPRQLVQDTNYNS